MADEQVKFDLLLEATQALLALKNVATGAQTAEQRIRMLTEAAQDFSKNTGANINDVVSNFRQVDESLTGISSKSEWNQVEKNVNGVGESLQKTGSTAKNTAGQFEILGTKVNLVRTAFGTFLAMGIFQFINAISGALRTLIDNLRETELAVYNLRNAEKKLSEEGIDITPKGLQETIDGVQKLVPIISKIQAEELTSRIATNVAPSLGFNKEQIDQLTKSVAVFYVQNKALGKSFDEVESQMTNAFLSGKVSTGINQLGIKITDQIVKDKALSMGLVKNSEAFDNLTGKEEANIKATAMLSLIWEDAQKKMGSMGEYTKTTDAQIEELKTQWSNLLTELGKDFAPVAVKGLEMLVNALKIIVFLLEAVKPLIVSVVVLLSGFIEGLHNIGTAFSKGGWLGAGLQFIEGFKKGANEAINKFKELQDQLDTPTGEPPKIPVPEIDITKAKDALQDMLKSLQDLQKKMADAESDFQTKLTRFDEDGVRERGQIVEDYNLNVLQTQRQFAQRKKDANDKYRQKEKEDERKFQEQMRQLQENFLYDLEDALRERDAKQVLRLTDKYNMEKQNMINENALRKKSADEQHKQDLEQMKKDEAERLLEMAEEEAVRLKRFDEEQAIKRKRMEEDHAIEMQRMKEQQDEIIRQAADKIAQEYDLNAQGADALYQLLSKYYGNNGALAKLTSQGYNAMLQQAGGFLAQMASMIAQYQTMMAGATVGVHSTTGIPIISTGTTGSRIPKLAKGGQFVATKPTTATFGESGNELVTITPLSQLSSMQNKQPLNGINGLDGRNGQTRIALDLNLSPDLEARVVNKAMDGTADIVQKINRTKE